MMSDESFEPRIIGFLCNWCTYAAADTAGVSRMKQPANIDIIRMMCSGRVDPTFILKAFREGADGVLVAGCHPGDCHYSEGNYKTLRRMTLLQRMLEQMGIEPGRFRLEWVSSAEAPKWAKLAREFTEQVRALGPLNWPGTVLAGLPTAAAHSCPQEVAE
jgi:F420-non-reducing hydrogenase iron-sulfur subunit